MFNLWCEWGISYRPRMLYEGCHERVTNAVDKERKQVELT